MKLAFITVGIIILFGFAWPCNMSLEQKGGLQVSSQDIASLMSKIDAADEPTRMKLLSDIDGQRSELLGTLLKYMGPNSSKNVQVAAIYLIGRHRLANGVPALIQHIDLDAGERLTRGPEPLWDRYPALDALITIGRPSIPAAIELLATEHTELRRELGTKVVRYVEGYDVAKFILDRAFANETDSKRKARLRDAQARLEKLPRD